MKKKNMLWVLATIATASCSQYEVVPDGRVETGQITFTAGATRQTRAKAVNAATFAAKSDDWGIGIYGYTTGQTAWAEYLAGASITPSFMQNVLLKHNGVEANGGAWSYDNVKEWPEDNGKLSFIAYYPKMITGSGTTASLTAEKLPQVVVNITDGAAEPAITPATMYDFVTAQAIDQDKATNGAGVELVFGHTMSRVNLKARMSAAANLGETTAVFLTGVTFTGVVGEGTYKWEKSADPSPMTSGWDVDVDGATGRNLTLGEAFAGEAQDAFFGYNKKSVKLTAGGEITSLLKDGEYLFFIPNGLKEDAYATVEYDIATKVAPSSYSTQHRSVKVMLDELTLTAGKAYDLCFTIGVTAAELNTVAFSVSAVDWTEPEETPEVVTMAEASTFDAAGIEAAWAKLDEVKGNNDDLSNFLIEYRNSADAELPANIDLSGATTTNFYAGDQITLQVLNSSGQPQDLNDVEVTLPESWITNKISNAYGGQNIILEKTHDYVDLGLSVKWATCNVGASKPEEIGTYFSWGHTTAPADGNYSQAEWIGYDKTAGNYKGEEKLRDEGVIDANNNLTSAYDAATANWGGSWRMPTKQERDELIANTECSQTEVNGVSGFKVTSTVDGYTDKYIFLPATGYYNGFSISRANELYYLTASITGNNAYIIYGYINNSSNAVLDKRTKFADGCCVRAVKN